MTERPNLQAGTFHSPIEPGTAGKLLLVQQGSGLARRLEEILDREFKDALRLVHCEDIAAALLRLRDERFDLILLDLDLPDSRGLGTATSILHQEGDTFIIVLCSSEDYGTVRMALRGHIQDVLLKTDVTPEVLLPTLQLLLDQHQLRLSLQQNIRELEVSNGRFLSLVIDNADAIVVVDANGVIRFVNPAAERLLQCSAATLLGDTFGIPLEGAPRAELDLVSRAGGRRVAEMHVMRSLWDGELAFIATLRDITERKSRERELRIAKQTAEQANSMKSQFLANMSHELRTPLNSILGFSEMILNGVMGEMQPNRYSEYVRNIHQCGSHLLLLINDLLDLSKAESGMLMLNEKTFDLAEMIDSVRRIVAPQATSRDLDLSATPLVSRLWLRADDRMIRQVLLNLLSNAIKFTEPGGTVSLEVRTDGHGQLRLAVIDNGIGIPRNQIPRAFAAFVQVENAYRKSDHEGTGLGLALSKRLVELHGGSLSLDSDTGKGTAAVVVLPSWRVIGDGGEASAPEQPQKAARCGPTLRG